MNGDNGFLKDKMRDYRVEPPGDVWKVIEAGIHRKRRRRFLVIGLAAAASLALAITLGIRLILPDLPADNGLASSGEDAGFMEDQHRQGIESPVTGEPGTGNPVREETEPWMEVRSETVPEYRTTKHIAVNELHKDSTSENEEYAGLPPETATGEFSEPSSPGETITALPDQIVENEVPAKEDHAARDESDIEDPVPVQVQDPEEPGKREQFPPGGPRWMLGAVFSPLYSYRDASNEALAGTAGQESGVLSYAGGIQVIFKTTRRLAIETGAIFNKTGLEVAASGVTIAAMNLDNVPVGSDRFGEDVKAVTNSVGNIISTEGEIYVNNYKLIAELGPEAVNNIMILEEVSNGEGIKQHLDYLEIPLNVRYTLVDRDLKLQLVGGVSTNLLVNNYVTMEGTDGPLKIGYLSNVKTVNYSGNAGLGMAYSIFSNLLISVEPRFRYYLNSVNDQTLPSTRPYTFGLYTGLSYTF